MFLLDSVWSLTGFVTNLERFWDLKDVTVAAEVTSSILNDKASFDFIADAVDIVARVATLWSLEAVHS